MKKTILAPDRNETEYSFEYKGDLYYVLKNGRVVGGEMFLDELKELIRLYRLIYSSPKKDWIYKFAEDFYVDITDYIDRTGNVH